MKAVSQYKANQSGTNLLNANESYRNLEDTIISEIREAIDTIDFNRYPEDENINIRSAYASLIQKQATQVIAGNGSDEMLGLMISLFIKQGKKLFTLSPDFSMYDYYVSIQGGEMVKYHYGINDTFDVEAFIKQGTQEAIDLIVFSNPNNPTGRLIKQNELKQILEAFSNIPVIIDEAYADFCEETMLDYIDEYDNLYVTRTLSKAYAMAGVRCGFLISNKKNIDYIKTYKVPYNVNVVTQTIVKIALKHTVLFEQRIEEIKCSREALYEAYTNIQDPCITLYPSTANYLYGTTKYKEQLFIALDKAGITIRNYEDDSIRITIGSKQQNEKILEIIRQISKEVRL